MLLRTQVEVAMACGVPERGVVVALGVARTTIYRWVKSDGARRAREAKRAWGRRNPEQKLEQHRRWREKYPERYRDGNRRKNRKCYEENPGYYIEKTAVRRAKMKRWPCSAVEKMMIRNKYLEARLLSRETGIQHHVDHIWPVSKGGPHLPWNLRVVTAEENLRKRDRL